MYTIVGLGNPGAEYKRTRHNAGRSAVEALTGVKANLVIPNSYMNKSGDAVKLIIKNAKQVEQLVIVHDDLNVPFGSFKISFNKSSGGHKGVESIIRALKTQAFTRVRIGISPTTPSGKLKKPKGEAAVEKHILGKFKPSELAALKNLHKKINEALITLTTEGQEKAMSKFNSYSK